MRKLFFSIVFMGVSGIISANTITNTSEIVSETPVSKVCCIRSATNAGGEVVTIRACVESTGDTEIDRGKACSRASKLANALVVAMDTLQSFF